MTITIYPAPTISGPTGPTGPAGITGPTGPTGPTLSQLAFSVYKTTGQTINGNTKIIFDTADFDTTSSYSFINNQFKPNKAGY